MLPILEELVGLSKEEVEAELKKAIKESKEVFGMDIPLAPILSRYLKELGLE